MKLRRTTATLVTAATLALGVGALAAPAGAQTDTTGAPTKERACQVARDRWAKIVWADGRAREEYRETRARQEWLANHGREEAAAKLDAKLDKLQATHASLVAKAQQLRDRYEVECGSLGDAVDPSALS